MSTVAGDAAQAGRPRAASVRFVPTGAITPDLWDELWALTCRFYQADRAYVEEKLKGHQHIVLFRDRGDGTLVGMAAVQVDALQVQERRLLMIFTSHAIVDERYRGQNLLQRAGARSYLRCWLRYPLHRKYWVFDTFSYRSYLLLPRNMREFWPRRDRPTPGHEAAVMEAYGRLKYGESWRDGVIARSPRKKLLPQTASLTPELQRHPDLAFFASVNPGHAEGDMLLCLCPLSAANWWGIASRWAARAWRGRRGPA
ncbi:hypothetical protein H8N03_10550 [Ramlibacter sp. USB13]|uniref:Uncharacterized protein n=1 Tax=Ramlibacter cellulosilyticus TaxID=2764187 RepID=A0A923SB30_9BURK|nr:hypothetical protein [Ramlibacter cellulosilyticus]MBC5783384.1 hypothetical protein [Ramlibacter cellulosilyticus]